MGGAGPGFGLSARRLGRAHAGIRCTSPDPQNWLVPSPQDDSRGQVLLDVFDVARWAVKTRILTRRDIERITEPDEILRAVEEAFRAHGLQQTQMPPKSYIFYPRHHGDLRTMPAYIEPMEATGVKIVNVHLQNKARGLPTVMAVIVLNDPTTGYPLAIMDGTWLTALRTGAAGAIAAKYLARSDSRRIGFVGCGVQAETQLLMTQRLFHLQELAAFDIDERRRDAFCAMAAERYGLRVVGSNRLEDIYTCDIITTTTPSTEPILKDEGIRPGTHINAIGADAPGKEELDPAILQRALIVVDSWEQAVHSGEINVPIDRGLITREDIYAELGEIVAGLKPGRTRPDQITVFDSTGLAIQDIASAHVVWAKARTQDVGLEVDIVGVG